LIDWAISNIKKKDGDLMESGTVTIKCMACCDNFDIVLVGDGWAGDALNGPYDVIHVGAAAESIISVMNERLTLIIGLPASLVEQLAFGGRMLIPLGTSNQKLVQVDKSVNGTITQKTVLGVRYVPLVRR
jgi:protein-L-isoaspartate(D-aspartate) O-methyltransferase